MPIYSHFDFIFIFIFPGMWTVSNNNSGTISIVRNLYWEGFSFYTVLGTPEYGNVYFGTGIPNYDIVFML